MRGCCFATWLNSSGATGPTALRAIFLNGPQGIRPESRRAFCCALRAGQPACGAQGSPDKARAR
eukprot:2700434-Prymnesium_polylepis.1